MLKVIQQNSYNLHENIFWKNNSKHIHVNINDKNIEIFFERRKKKHPSIRCKINVILNTNEYHGTLKTSVNGLWDVVGDLHKITVKEFTGNDLNTIYQDVTNFLLNVTLCDGCYTVIDIENSNICTSCMLSYTIQKDKKTEHKCPICLDSLNMFTLFKTSCNHIFHNVCIQKLKKHKCPCCRNLLTPQYYDNNNSNQSNTWL